VRLWIETESPGWVPLAKGGRRSPYYADVHLVVKWLDEGAELKAAASEFRMRKGWGDQWTAVLNGHSLYFKAGITWPHRSARFSASALPAGCIFTKAGKAAFAGASELPWLLGLMNSEPAALLLRAQSDAVRIKFEVGLVGQLPVPALTPIAAERLGSLARRAWEIHRDSDSVDELSHAFVLPALLQAEGRSFDERFDAHAQRAVERQRELSAIQDEVDKLAREAYGLSDRDWQKALEGLQSAPSTDESDGDADDDDETDDAELVETNASDSHWAAKQLNAWTIGVALGRFDVRLVTGDRVVGPRPGPFESQPSVSPGMLDRLDNDARRHEPSFGFGNSGVLVDDPGHPLDAVAAVHAVYEEVFGESANEWVEATSELVDPGGRDLRKWLATGLFDHHLLTHSRSRRKAPIYWQFGTSSGRYSIWLYAHKATPDTLFQLQNDILAPKLAYEERQLTNLVEDAGGTPSAKVRRSIEAQEAFVGELRLLREEVRRVAPLWRPTLDDGIVLAMAPLWRLVPHRGWQRELKKKWSELAEGNYDWAQLAMHVWPERVVLKCAEDRSLAVAHGLEDVFWIQDGGGKWQPRDEPTREVEELVRERTSVAVKEALGSGV
jgi:hypothetical protein